MNRWTVIQKRRIPESVRSKLLDSGMSEIVLKVPKAKVKPIQEESVDEEPKDCFSDRK